MRPRWSVMFSVFAVALAACTQAPRQGSSHHELPQASPAQRLPVELLVLGTGTGVATLDPATGALLFEGKGVPALADWSKLFTATGEGGHTVLRAMRADSGATISTAMLPRGLAIRAVSSDGQKVALMAPLPKGTTPWDPRPRVFTDIVVADPTGQVPPSRFHLRGNFEPEAFSSDGTGLFMIQYLPPTAPAAYRVARLDLNERKVQPVYGREKSPVETMTGTRLTQVPSPDAATLYTLYTSQPSEYARGYDSWQAHAGRPVAFVHTLKLDEGWATCVGLPNAFWGGDPSHEALAVSTADGRVYIVDTARRVVAVMDTGQLKVVRTRSVDLGPTSEAQVHAAMAPDGRTLFVANGARIVAVDTTTLQRTGVWSVAGPVSGLGASPNDGGLFVALRGQVELIDPSTGQKERMLPAPAMNGLRYVGTLQM